MSIGKSVRRVDAVAKVTGKARFTNDFFMPGTLVAGYLHSTIAHGRVKDIDTSRAEILPGVEAVFTYKDVPKHRFATAGHPYSLNPAHRDVSDRLLLTDHVRYYGDEIAVVVAETDLVLGEALKLLDVTYDEYEPILSTKRALSDSAKEIHECSNNIIDESSYSAGVDIENALDKPDIFLIEGGYRTQITQHCHLENHITYAYMNDLEHIVIVSSTQIPHIARRIVGEALNLPLGRIKVIKPYIGGGFGAKQDVILEPMLAFLTMRLGGRPVKINLSREECMIGTRIRHPFEINIKAGVNNKGELKALDMDILSNSGAYASHGHSVPAAAGFKVRYLYPRSSIRFRAKSVYTNIPAAGAMRAYGSPQLMFAIESVMEDAARKAAMDSVEFRLKNVARPGDLEPMTRKPIKSCGIIECLKKGRELIRWDEKRAKWPKQSGKIRRGLGVACTSYTSGTYPDCMEIAGSRLILNQDGSLHVQVGATEIGQGSDTVIAQMVAETTGVPVESVHVVSTQDTDVAPFDTGAYASRQTYVVSNAVFKAATDLKTKILELAGRMTGYPGHELDVYCGNIIICKDVSQKLISVQDVALEAYYNKDSGGQMTADVSLKTTSNAPVYGCTFVELEINLPLCKVEIKEIYNIHDSGKIINPQLAKGQVLGGIAMGIGAGLFEELQIDPETGRIYNNNLLDYKIPTIMDLPDLGCAFVETFEPTSGYGNKSLGEPPIITPSPAIRNAILDATGIAINEMPITPKVLFRYFKESSLL